MKENSPVHQLGKFADRPWEVSEIGGMMTADTEAVKGPQPLPFVNTRTSPCQSPRRTNVAASSTVSILGAGTPIGCGTLEEFLDGLD